MFSAIRGILGAIKVEQRDTEITISGIPANVMMNDISKIWKTSRINTHMFTVTGRSVLSFPNFFAPDVVYMIDKLLEHRSTNTNARSLNVIKNLLLTETWLKDTNREHTPRLDYSKINNLIYKPLDYQEEFLRSYDKLTQQYHLNGYLLAAAAGAGKAQPLDAKIKVPGGWSTMGEMKEGTEVIAKDGTVTKVTGVYPQGKKEIYKITFADGRSTECCKEHLWAITRPKRLNQQFREVVNTETLIKYLSMSSLRNRIYIDLIDAEDSVDKEYKLTPYVLGVYLGDGGSRGTANTVTVCNPDSYVINKLQSQLPVGCVLANTAYGDKCPTFRIIRDPSLKKIFRRDPFKNALIHYKLIGLKSTDKFIPTEYLHGSYQQRMDLLNGLMDTDGTCGLFGASSYSTSSPQLAKDVQYLVRSLGGIAYIGLKHPKYTYKGELKNGLLYYNIHIRFKIPCSLFSLPRKGELAGLTNQYSKHLKLRISSIESIGKKEAQCISIEHPERLYVTDDFIVTHNTYINLALAECLDMDRIVVVCPKNATERVWESETIKLFKKKQTYWVQQQGKPYNGERVVILHYEALEKVLDIVDKIKTKRCMVILDECHNLNEVNSKRTQLYHELIKALESKDIIYASGTAIKALGAEAIPLLRAIDPYFTEDAEQRFKKIYGANGVKGLDILQHRIGLVSFKVEKHQLGLDKPIIKRLPINIPNANLYTLPAIREDMRKFIEERWAYYNARKDSDLRFYNECLDIHKSKLRSDTETSRFNLYKGFVKDIQNANGDARFVADEMKWCNAYEKTDIIPNLPKDKVADFKSIKSTIKYTNLKIQGEALGRVLGRKRIECHVDMVPHVDFAGICGSTTKKTVVFTSFVEALEASEKHLTEIGMNPVVVYGKTNNELNKTVGLFEKDIDLNPLVATYQSLSTAVPLVMADTMIMLNAPFRAYIHEQAISRIHRLGADTQTIVWEAYLNTGETPNISTRSGDILQWSQQQVEAIMGIASPFEIEEGDGVITVANESLGISECVTVKEVMEKMKRKENSFLDW